MMFLFISILIVLISIYVTWPLFQPSYGKQLQYERMQILLEQKEYLQSEQKNLEHDYTLDRLDKASFESMQAELQANLDKTIQQIEKLMGMKYSKLEENLLDQLRGKVTNEVKLNYCPQCGQTFTRSDRYCSQCGFKLRD
ncbi:hypothetical protein GF407_13185 [candidate division KSB1 bacterium]|nr:hypothetical protein [candidate division KSB1 bacterium]